MITNAQKQEFQANGLFRIPNAFSEKDCGPMRRLILDELEAQCGIDRDDPTTWQSEVWPKFQNIKFDPVFDAIGGKKTRAVLDEMLGEWERPSNWGQFIVQLPKPAEEWKVPHYLWHTDFGYDVSFEPLPGLLMISFISDVGPRGGGTGFVTGSHKLVRKYVKKKGPDFCSKMRRVRESLMASDQWLISLSDENLTERERLLEIDAVVNGWKLRVIDLSGNAGDIVFAHPWLLHTSSINSGNSISMRRVQRIHVAPFKLDPETDS